MPLSPPVTGPWVGPHVRGERRRSPRQASGRECLVRRADAPESPRWFGRVLDVSATGCRLALGGRFTPGAVLEVIPLGPDLPRTERARVVYSIRQADDCLYGCEFTEQLDEQQVRRWLG